LDSCSNDVIFSYDGPATFRGGEEVDIQTMIAQSAERMSSPDELKLLTKVSRPSRTIKRPTKRVCTSCTSGKKGCVFLNGSRSCKICTRRGTPCVVEQDAYVPSTTGGEPRTPSGAPVAPASVYLVSQSRRNSVASELVDIFSVDTERQPVPHEYASTSEGFWNRQDDDTNTPTVFEPLYDLLDPSATTSRYSGR
jgi:hypothetical protein